jgi:hypothetical protein
MTMTSNHPFHPARRTPSTHLAVLLGLGLAVGCGSGVDTGIPTCTSDSECDDGHPCTIDACGSDSICHHDAAPDGLVDDQVPGDCLAHGCQDGQLGDWPSDDPFDDGNPCTEDLCSDGSPTNPRVVEGSLCAMDESNNGTCAVPVDDPGGFECIDLCLPATGAMDCDDANACTLDACDDSLDTCVHDVLTGVAAPGTEQVAGDCQIIMCVEGVTEVQSDPTDPPPNGTCS